MAASFSARKAVTSLLLPTAAVGSTTVAIKQNRHAAFCEASATPNDPSKDLLDSKRGVTLKKRMTAIGRFTLKSETLTNPSVPTFFIALSGDATNKEDKSSSSSTFSPTSQQETGMTVPEFESLWIKRNIPVLHPRFHCFVSKLNDGYFESKTVRDKKIIHASNNTSTPTNLSQHTSETLHTSVYREDLKKRLEGLLMKKMDVFERLWEVQISSGALGSSGAIGKKATEAIYNDTDEKTKKKKVESLLLFRCHHSLGDAVSLVAAFGDLLDEAEDIRAMIKAEIRKRRAAGKSTGFLVKLWKLLQKMTWLLVGGLKELLRYLYLIATTKNNPFLDVLNRTSSEGLEVGRSISWCDFAPVEEVHKVAKIIGPKVTLNDVFVSCVTAAVARQLAEHREKAIAPDGKDDNTQKVYDKINVAIPVHLAGGIIPPGREVGNLIGGIMSQVPGEMKGEYNVTASDRLLQVHSSLYKSKRSPAPIVSFCVAKIASSILPDRWATSILNGGTSKAAVAVTNSRGLPEKVHMNGRAVESMVGFLPLPPGLPVGVVISSYNSVVSLSVTAEKWAVPDADRFLGWVLDEYKLLCKEALIKEKH